MKLLDIKSEKYTLKNGMEVILYNNNSFPLVAVNIWYKVGSAQEEKGKTGLAHLFEHMMFQGSENVPKEMHFKFIQEAGGTLNGSTSFDRTNYFEKLPSNELELALWLESDRMGFLLNSLDQEKLENQKSVVYNERLERYDNQPYGLAWELLISNLYNEGHPYSWATIGYLNDIKNYELDDVKNFFKKYYSSNNASLVVAGDFEAGKVKELISKYFESITANSEVKNISIKNEQLKSSKKIIHEDSVQLERIYLAWHSVKAFEKDDAELDILSDILAGSKNSRLHKKLVHELEIAQDIYAMQFSGKYAGHFMIVATAKPKKSLDEINKVINDELDLIINEGISSKELKKSKNGIKSGFIFSLQNLDSLADHLNLYNFYFGRPNSFMFDLERYNAVNEIDVMQVAAKYLKANCVDLRIVPKGKNGN
ncbi:MAG: insulinase family protein [Ignavibacteriaceae bacterium]|nr:insulinase family protein [Ignavibacteriaceae bacterium]